MDNEAVMWRQLFQLDPSLELSLQRQLREQLVSAILDGRVSDHKPLPSSRVLARHLSVSRNTVVIAYQQLIDENFLIARERQGYFVNRDILAGRVQRAEPTRDDEDRQVVDWANRAVMRPSRMRNIVKPDNWRAFDFPFVYGQPDPSLIPVNDWRECSRQASSVSAIHDWSRDRVDHDNAELVEQIRLRVLPRRGVFANEDEVLITLGAQNALMLVSNVLHGPRSIVAVENPGYTDARNMFRITAGEVRPVDIDDAGLVVSRELDGCNSIYVTPSHQSPTTATMPLERRKALLAKAREIDAVIIEDDYESETNYLSDPVPALKSLDQDGRVIYVGSLSKVIAPGLRIGYLVAPAPLVRELRAFRRFGYRHPPTNNQQKLALFLSLGHYDALVTRLHKVYRERWSVLGEALNTHLPEASRAPSFGGTAFWVSGPDTLNAETLSDAALKQSVLIEPGTAHYHDPENAPMNTFRLGFSSIDATKIAEGVSRVSKLVRALS
ncbi:MAG: PLP-dependent aminotransferase family protein [Pseudomonadota bacterium]